ncbi:hypothetical protein [Streptacidiphilus sp. MAP5-52]|uniref:hypothetical protein n=1 Tax=Streptacidiphilus sp. MAP5-52 TaxID=3156267 RepID=UPI0035144F3C
MRLRSLLLTTTTALVLALSACSTAGTPTTHATSPANRPTTPPAPLTQAQLTKAAIGTADVQSLHMGVAAVTADNTVISSGTLRVHPDQCQPLMDAWQGGQPDYNATAAEDLKILEADATGPAAVHFLHLAAYPSTTAQAYLDALTTATGHCTAYDQPDTDGPIHVTITPDQVALGDQSTAWHAVLTNSGKSFYAAITVVRVGNSVVTAVELSDSVTAPEQLPLTNPDLLAAQIGKLRSAPTQ